VRNAKAKRKLGAPPRVLWVTRAQPGADATAARLRALGLAPVVAPLLEVRRLDRAPIDLTDVCALAFTSANAVAAFAERCERRDLRVFAVGDATARAARERRFQRVLSAQGDVKALAAALAARRRELTGVILYPAATEPAQDLAGALAAVGLSVRQVALYETATVEPAPALIARLPEIGGVLVHSARAGRALAAVLRAHPSPHLVAYCLSPQIARTLARSALAAVIAADAPNEEALMALLAPAPGG
jgi:uroporphyrinogen-III synthase